VSEIEITTSPRGFYRYGEPWKDTHGNSVSVYESSSAMGPHVWVRIDGSEGHNGSGDATAHLNPEQARTLREQLDVFLNQIPDRWGQGH
jgi:hypothetical protein